MKRGQLLGTLGPNHPYVKEVDEMIKEVKRIYKGGIGGDTDDVRPDPDNVESYIAIMQAEIKKLDTNIETLSNLFDSDSTAAREMSIQELKEEKVKSRLEQSQEFLKVLLKRIQEIDTIKGKGGYVAEKIAPPILGKKVSPN